MGGVGDLEERDNEVEPVVDASGLDVVIFVAGSWCEDEVGAMPLGGWPLTDFLRFLEWESRKKGCQVLASPVTVQQEIK